MNDEDYKKDWDWCYSPRLKKLLFLTYEGVFSICTTFAKPSHTPFPALLQQSGRLNPSTTCAARFTVNVGDARQPRDFYHGDQQSTTEAGYHSRYTGGPH